MSTVCFGADAVVVALPRDGVAVVELADGTVREVSTAVLAADDVVLGPGDAVWVSMGMALRRTEPAQPFRTRAART